MTRPLIAALLLLAAGCAAPEGDALAALRGTGLRDIRLGGYPFFACSDDDTFNSEFTATNRDGQPVSGAVCCGLLKGCTVRFR